MPTGVRKTQAGRWEAQVSHHGKRRFATFDTQREAVAWRESQRTASRRGDWIDPRDASTTLRQWLDTWLEDRRPSLAEGSFARYESIVRLHLVPAFGHLPLSALDPSSVQRWINTTAAEQGAAAVHTQVPVLRAALSAAVRRRMVPHNVATMVDLPSHSAKRMTFLEPDELRALLEHEDREWARDAILGLAFTGARFGELAALTPADVNMLKATIDLYATKTQTHRTIAIAGPLREVLERRLSLGHEHVFTTESGAVLRAPNFRNRVWYPLCAEAGVRDVRVHDLRHTCASWLIGSGANPVQVCAWLGHSKPTQTLDTYAHIFRADMESLADSLDRMWATPTVAAPVLRHLEVGS